LAQRLAARGHTPILLGMNTAVADEEGNIQPFNSAILLDREGDWAGRYDKIHRVPFGEYIPLRSMLPVLNRLAPYDFDYVVRPGSGFTPLEMSSSGKVYRFGVLICYEDTDPAMALPYARGPRPVDFLVNISNDGWFDGTEEHDQHLALCRFRAIETRRAVARSVNMGISAVVDGNGRILAPRQIAKNDRASVWTVGEESGSLPVSGWVPFKQTSVVLIASVPLDARSSIYASIGDLFAWCCAGVLLVLLGLSWFSPRNNRP
ncbi:MAG: apolipoprotein N-acyltransferase, partial [Gemmataceae bacterium]